MHLYANCLYKYPRLVDKHFLKIQFWIHFLEKTPFKKGHWMDILWHRKKNEN